MSEAIYIGLWLVYMFSITSMLHIMQLEGYKIKEYINWITKNYKKAFKSYIVQLLFVVLAYVLSIPIKVIYINTGGTDLGIMRSVEFFMTVFAYFISNIFYILKSRKELKSAKKPLKYTARVCRLIFWNFVVFSMLMVSFEMIFENIIVAHSIFIATIPINMILSAFLASPLEDVIGNYYIANAKMKINNKKYKNLIRIGITGSYGKTSTKFILATILGEKYNVLATPESYNTTMGNVKIIRKELKEEHQVFISEMGARYKGDIKEICNFVKPQIGIITSIGPQHLETFKNIENIVKTKKELIDNLPQDGIVVLPRDNEHCYNIYKKENRTKYSYSVKNQNTDVYITDMELDENGSSFVVHYKEGTFKCNTKLLGEHNVENILGCIMIALHLGLAKDEIIRGVSKIEPIQHRLQILPTSNGTTVIDDAFNSNPKGSKMALDILKKFKGRKIIITPGMVELGKEEYKYNKEFGEYMARCVDIAILVGKKRTEPIVQGLKSQKFNDLNIHIVNNLDEATKELAKFTRSGDVILFENDLPDNYNE